MKHRKTSVGWALLGPLALVACLDDKSPALDCGQGGDAFAYAGAGYCMYTGAIIIEGFDCPAMVPFEHRSGDVVVCAPSEQPPEGGWEVVVQSWQEQRPGVDAAQPETDATDSGAADTSPVDTSPVDTSEPGPDIIDPPYDY